MASVHTKHEESDEEDFDVPMFIKEDFDPSKKPMYCKHKVYEDGQEFSLEEIRARHYMAPLRNVENIIKDCHSAKQQPETIIDDQSTGWRTKPAVEEGSSDFKEKKSALLDSAMDKENIYCQMKQGTSDIKSSVSASQKHSVGDKNYTKYDMKVGNISLLDDVFLKPSSQQEFDITSYTKAFKPHAISTPGSYCGKNRMPKGMGNDSDVLRKPSLDENDVAEHGPKSSELSIIEETSKECTSGSSGGSSTAAPVTPANDNQLPSVINKGNGGSVKNSSQVPSVIRGGIHENLVLQGSRIPCSVNRAKRTNASGRDTSMSFRELSVVHNSMALGESLESRSDEDAVKNNKKDIVCGPVDEMCKQFEEMIIAQDPFEPSLTDDFLKQLSVPVTNRIGYYSVLQKLPLVKANLDLHLRKESRDGGHLFKSLKVIGQGAYAKVYKAYSAKWKKTVALKIQKPPCPWEFYICNEVHERITDFTMKCSIMNVKEACFFHDGSVLVSDFMEYGTLLDVINLFKLRRIKIPEALVVYFVLDILRIIHCLHSCKIIHADVKPDNFLLKRLPKANEDFSLLGQTTLQLIDLGRSIDMTLYPPNTCFDSVFQKTFFQCIEMRSKRQWTYQVDMFHIASLVHVMMFGEFMDIFHRDSVWNITRKIPRNFNQDLWTWFFNVMLNIESCVKLPDLLKIIQTFEKTLLNSMIQDLPSAITMLRKFINEDKNKQK